MYLSDGLLRLFFKPMLLLLLPRRLAWFFTTSSHMPMLPEEPPLPPLLSIPPGPPHMPTPSTHWLPMEELPIDMPECWKQREIRLIIMTNNISIWVAYNTRSLSLFLYENSKTYNLSCWNSRGLSAAGLFVVAAASGASQPPAAFPAEPEPGAFLTWWAQRMKPHSSLSRLPQAPAAGGSAAATSWSVPAADDTAGRYDRGQHFIAVILIYYLTNEINKCTQGPCGNSVLMFSPVICVPIIIKLYTI